MTIYDGRMSDPDTDPGAILDSAKVLCYATVDDSVGCSGHSNLFVGGVEIGRVPYLAICQNKGESEVLVFHCDGEWNVLGCAVYDSVDSAKERIERVYPGLSSRWIESPYTDEDAERCLEELYGDSRCSFCGRRADQVRQMFGGTSGSAINV